MDGEAHGAVCIWATYHVLTHFLAQRRLHHLVLGEFDATLKMPALRQLTAKLPPRAHAERQKNEVSQGYARATPPV